MSTTAQYAATPLSARAAFSTANTNRDGTGTITALTASQATGHRVDEISFKATATTTAGMVRLWLYNGSAYTLWREVPVAAVTPTASVASWEAYLVDLGLVLAPGWSLAVSTHNAESFVALVTRAGVF